MLDIRKYEMNVKQTHKLVQLQTELEHKLCNQMEHMELVQQVHVMQTSTKNEMSVFQTQENVQ